MIRRKLLASVAAAILGVSIAGCTVVSGTTNTTTKVTTITVDVSKLAALTEAAKNLVDQIMALPGLNLDVATVAAVNVASNLLVADVLALNNATGGSTTLTFDNSSPPAALASVQKDMLGLQSVVMGAVGSLNNTAVQQYLSVLSTTVLLFEGTVGSGVAPVPAK